MTNFHKQHQYCLKSSDTWCRYWKDVNEETNTYNEDNRLPSVFAAELEPIFKRLSNDELLVRCLKGLTQNQNEAIKLVKLVTFIVAPKIMIKFWNKNIHLMGGYTLQPIYQPIYHLRPI